MKITNVTRNALAHRRQQKKLLGQGYDYVEEPIWEMHRGGRTHHRIVDVQISVDGKSLYVKTEAKGKFSIPGAILKRA